MDKSRRYLDLCCEVCGEYYLQQERVYRIAVWKNRCPKHRKNPTKIYKCRECGIEVSRGYDWCKKCYGLSMRYSQNYCLICNKEILYNSTLCLLCHNKNQFKGKTTERNRFNNNKKWQELREFCFKRDNYTCQNCGDKNYKGRGKTIRIEAHHIKNWSDYKDLRLDPDNIITLCYNCHKQVHSIKNKIYAEL